MVPLIYLPPQSVCLLDKHGRCMGKGKKQPPRVASMSALGGQLTRNKTQGRSQGKRNHKDFLKDKQKELEWADRLKEIERLKL